MKKSIGRSSQQCQIYLAWHHERVHRLRLLGLHNKTTWKIVLQGLSHMFATGMMFSKHSLPCSLHAGTDHTSHVVNSQRRMQDYLPRSYEGLLRLPLGSYSGLLRRLQQHISQRLQNCQKAVPFLDMAMHASAAALGKSARTHSGA